jgi:periplasmic divalent cation tolerance protein
MNTAAKVIIGYVSFPVNDVIKNVARILVSEKLVACAKVIKGIESFYIWEDKVCEDEELYLWIKFTEDRVDEIKDVLNKHHPYSVYEFLYFEAKGGNEKYLAWVRETTTIKKIDI